MTYKGSCHCQKVQYEVLTEVQWAAECNCSMCSKKGTLLAFVPFEQFKLVSGSEYLTNYQFHRKIMDHTFCKVCGVTPFLNVQDPHGNKMKAINVRCLEELDLKSLEIKQVDGKSF